MNTDTAIKDYISDKFLNRLQKDITQGHSQVASIKIAVSPGWAGVFKDIFEAAKQADTDLQEQSKRLKNYMKDAAEMG